MTIANGETGASVRAKINQAFADIDELETTAFSQSSAIASLQTSAAKQFETVALLLADTSLTYAAGSVTSVAAGNIIEAGGFRYEVAPIIAVDHHVTTAGGVRLYVLPGARGFDVRAFGALVGVVGQDAPIDKCLLAAAAASAPAYFPRGQWRKSSALTINVPQGDNGFSIVGDGDGVSNIRLDTGGDGLTINLPGNWWIYGAGGSTAFRCQDIVFSTTNANTGTGIKIIGASVAGRPGPSIRFSRCMWRAHNSFGQFWALGLEVLDCQNTWYDFCRWECGGPSNSTANGVYIDGTAQANSPTLHYFTSCTWDYGNIALEIGDFVEGVYLTQPTIVAANIGVRWHPSQGESGLVIDGGHMNTKQRWVSLDNVFDWEIYGGHYYRSGDDATFRGIRIANSGRGLISNNVFVGRNSADGSDIAIEVNSLINDEARGMWIGGNTFHNWQTRAIWATANANYLKIGANLFRNCSTSILNQSSNNSVSVTPETFARTVSHSFVGGATTETVDVALPLGLFRLTPIGLVTVDSASRTNIRGFYDFANSTTTVAKFVFENPAGGNIAAGARRFHVHVSENVTNAM